MTISNDFEKIATKNKRKNRLKTVGISVGAMLISALIIFIDRTSCRDGQRKLSVEVRDCLSQYRLHHLGL